MVMENDVLTFFQNELPIWGWLPTKNSAVGIDDVLQEYPEQEDLFPESAKAGRWLYG